MPQYNPLVGWQDDDGTLIGWSGQNAGGASDGYNGSVNSLGDFARAIAGGAGVVFGGLPGAVVAGANLAFGNAPTAGSPALMQSLRDWWSGSPITGTTTPTINTATQFNAPVEPGATQFVGAADIVPGGGLFDIAGNGEKGMAELAGGGFDAERMEGKNAEGKQGFASGGFTGGVEGQPRGVVHGQELVLSAPAVRALGPVAGELAAVNELVAANGPRSWAELIMMRNPRAWGG